MAKFSAKQGGKEVGSAAVYAEPHDMAGKAMKGAQESVTKKGNCLDSLNISVGGISKGNYEPINKNGEITMRGYGAATKGIKCRGPMA